MFLMNHDYQALKIFYLLVIIRSIACTIPTAGKIQSEAKKVRKL